MTTIINHPTAEKIRTLRTSAGLTQQELADKLGIAKARVSEWENGKVEPLYKTMVIITATCRNDKMTREKFIKKWLGSKHEYNETNKDLMREDLDRVIIKYSNGND